MTPIQRRQLTEFYQSREFIHSAIKRVGKQFSIDKSFDAYNDLEGCYLFSFETIENLNNLLEQAKQNFALQKIDLAAYVAQIIEKVYTNEPVSN
jgi:hypothetical protein